MDGTGKNVKMKRDGDEAEGRGESKGGANGAVHARVLLATRQKTVTIILP